MAGSPNEGLGLDGMVAGLAFAKPSAITIAEKALSCRTPEPQPQHEYHASFETRLDCSPSPDKVQALRKAPSKEKDPSNAAQVDWTVNRVLDQKTPHKVYSIPSLVEIGARCTDMSVMMKVRPEAIAENLFQYLGINRASDCQGRTRGLSTLSNTSYPGGQFNYNTNEEHGFSKSFVFPRRQPRAPPESFFSQQHDGFMRFLKQHASPPHNRVTAGGRIVPAGPLAPPPMFDYESLTGLVENGRSNVRLQQHLGTNTLRNSNHELFGGQRPQQARSNPLGNTHLREGLPALSAHISGYAEPTYFHGGLGRPQSSSLDPSVSPINSVQQIGHLVDGSKIVSCNGLLYRTYMQGPEIMVEPLQAASPLLHLAAPPTAEIEKTQPRQPFSDFSLRPNPTSYKAEEILKPSGMGLRGQESMSANVTNEAMFKSRLMELNRHLASHHFELDPSQRAALIAQRRSLTEELDKVRVSKASSSAHVPVVVADSKERVERRIPNTLLVKSPGLAELSTSMAKPTIQTRNSSGKQLLSAKAPAFVPSQPWAPAVISQHDEKQLTNECSVSKEGITAIDDHVVQTPTANTKSSSQETDADGQQYSPPDSRDPAMRLVHRNDIEYAASLSKEDHEKEFCTTVDEFQEAIRRVREQARLYGCHGGSSKDPAYDAEQDIWWAICDHDPIPLPGKTPDHVRHPRPWNWNDSAFNFRTHCALSPGGKRADVSFDSIMTCKTNLHHYESEYQNSRDFAPDTSTVAPHSKSLTLQYHLDEATRERPSNICKQQPVFSPAARPFVVYPHAQHRQPQTSLGERHVASSLHIGGGESSRITDDALQKLHKAQPTSSLASAKLEAKTILQDRSNEKVEDSASNGTLQSVRDSDQGNYSRSAQVDKALFQAENVFSGSDASIMENTQSRTGYTDEKGMRQDEALPQSLKSKKKALTDKCCIVQALQHPHDTRGELCGVQESTSHDNISTNKRDFDLGAISKTQWPPLNLAMNSPATGAKQSDYVCVDHNPSCTQVIVDRPHVNIPSSEDMQPLYRNLTINSTSPATPEYPATRKPRSEYFPELNLQRIEGLSDAPSTSFLRDMLKSTRYAREERSPDERSSMSEQSQQVGNNARNEDQRTTVTIPREKTMVGSKSPNHHSHEKSLSKENEAFRRKVNNHAENHSPSFTKRSTNTAIAFAPHELPAGKSSSSLASSSYQARGYLPLYEGAGKAHTSSIYQQSGLSMLRNFPRVRLPIEPPKRLQCHPDANSLHFADSALADTLSISIHSRPLAVGFDGSGDTPAGLGKDNGKSKEDRADSSSVIHTVTKADFHTQRADPNNPLHRSIVNEFFKDLYEKETKQMMALQRKKTKTLP